MLVGTNRIGSLSSCFALLLLGLNIFIQLVFLRVVTSQLNTPGYTDKSIGALRSWRRDIGRA